MHLTGLYPKWYPEKLRLKGACKGRIVATDFLKGVGEVIIPFIEEWLDEAMVARKFRNPMGVPIRWTLKNGSQFDILTHEQQTSVFEGWKGHIAWFDEPPPRDKYIATLRGLVDYAGRNWLTLTPLTEPWIYDDLYTKADGKNIYVVTTDIRDNTTLSEAAIKEFERSLTEDEKEARLHGRFMHLSGLIYKEFDSNVHICTPPKVKKSWTRYFCIDPHDRTPCACLWVAVDPQGNHWIYDELWLPDMDLEQVSHAIHAQEGDLMPHFRFIDPHMDKDNALAGGFNVRKELMKHGIYCQRANIDPLLGKKRIKQALKPVYSSITKTEQPLLRVSTDCEHTIYEFQHYVWDEYRRNKDEMAQKDSPKAKNNHFMDCLKYIYNADPRFVDKEAKVDVEESYTGTYTRQPAGGAGRDSGSGYRDLVDEPDARF